MDALDRPIHLKLTAGQAHDGPSAADTWAFMHGMTLEDVTAYFATSRETLEDVYHS